MTVSLIILSFLNLETMDQVEKDNNGNYKKPDGE